MRAVRAPADPASAPAPRELARLALLPPQEALARLDSCADGLTADEALARLERHGPNVVGARERHVTARRLAELVASPLSLLLLVLAVASWLTGEVTGAWVIALMVVLSALLSFTQEYRSSRAAARLRAMVGTTASVLRRESAPAAAQPRADAGVVHETAKPAHALEVPLAQLVPGDVVHLSAGDVVPADVRVLSARDLFVNEAVLTGESLPREKFAAALASAPASPLELPNIGFMGTHVVSGTAFALVVATGRGTGFGEIAARLSEARQPTPFDRGIERFIWLMVRFMAVMVPLVFAINGFAKGDWLEALLFAIAVAVGLTPEMLPMIVTINLAKGAIAMSGRRVIVKRLQAIQNFGAMDVLCADKTGTLTQDRVVLERQVDLAGNESDRVLELAYLNSAHQSGLKNLLDVAVLEHAREVEDRTQASSRYAKVDEIPFDFQRRRMSVIVAQDGARHLLICKGAVEEVLAVCAACEIDGAVAPIRAGQDADLRGVVRGLNEEGFRVIAVACREVPVAQTTYSVADERDLTLVGYVAFLDPPKESAAPALRRLHRRGVRVKILTGDNDAVARNVCRQVGLEVPRMLLGAEIERMSDAQLAEAARRATLFAKVSPAQKERVIGALRAGGHVVGFLGDGINDGPALQAADVGISVDTAVDVAKESADIILLEKSLLVLADGVVEGRKVFGNIVKYIKMSASSNFGNMLSVLGASAFLPFLPMAPVQILFNNLLYDVSQTTVATDEVDAEYTAHPRRWDVGNIGRFMLVVGPISSLFDYATFSALILLFGAWNSPALFHTGWFVESLLSQTLVVHVIRTGRIPFVQSRPSAPLLAATIAICATGALLPYSPLAPALGLVPLPASWWPVLALILAAYLSLTQVAKRWLVRRFGLD